MGTSEWMREMGRRPAQIAIVVIIEALVIAALGVAINVVTDGVTPYTALLLVFSIFLQAAVFFVLRVRGGILGADVGAGRPLRDRGELLTSMRHRAAVRIRERWEALQLSSETIDALEFIREALARDTA
jgi:hypothetical protein